MFPFNSFEYSTFWSHCLLFPLFFDRIAFWANNLKAPDQLITYNIYRLKTDFPLSSLGVSFSVANSTLNFSFFWQTLLSARWIVLTQCDLKSFSFLFFFVSNEFNTWLSKHSRSRYLAQDGLISLLCTLLLEFKTSLSSELRLAFFLFLIFNFYIPIYKRIKA